MNFLKLRTTVLKKLQFFRFETFFIAVNIFITSTFERKLFKKIIFNFENICYQKDPTCCSQCSKHFSYAPSGEYFSIRIMLRSSNFDIYYTIIRGNFPGLLRTNSTFWLKKYPTKLRLKAILLNFVQNQCQRIWFAAVLFNSILKSIGNYK